MSANKFIAKLVITLLSIILLPIANAQTMVYHASVTKKVGKSTMVRRRNVRFIFKSGKAVYQ